MLLFIPAVAVLDVSAATAADVSVEAIGDAVATTARLKAEGLVSAPVECNDTAIAVARGGVVEATPRGADFATGTGRATDSSLSTKPSVMTTGLSAT